MKVTRIKNKYHHSEQQKQIKAPNRILLFLLLLNILLISCSKKELFSEFRSFHDSEWSRQEIVRFEVPMQDTLSLFEVFLEIRSNNDYPFQNIWLFIDYQNPEGKVRSDTLQAELADIYGKWYGKGISLYSYSFPYDLNARYPEPGTYVYTICQGMREEPLRGISDIGLRITKKSDQ